MKLDVGQLEKDVAEVLGVPRQEVSVELSTGPIKHRSDAVWVDLRIHVETAQERGEQR